MSCKADQLVKMFGRLQRFLADARGATAIEYGLIVALLSVALIGVFFATGDSIKTVLYGSIVNALKAM